MGVKTWRIAARVDGEAKSNHMQKADDVFVRGPLVVFSSMFLVRTYRGGGKSDILCLTLCFPGYGFLVEDPCKSCLSCVCGCRASSCPRLQIWHLWNPRVSARASWKLKRGKEASCAGVFRHRSKFRVTLQGGQADDLSSFFTKALVNGCKKGGKTVKWADEFILLIERSIREMNQFPSRNIYFSRRAT
ncbi:hypothetical protein DQ04_00661050 [Trypanosoma grayi]|uniref:hypothetical protein n=1 Tax=Trypanosoma grayi TaxID=71804 RepID=UPI0004F43750|nr:hypothetical protein DQ04_00661050 [Trypanosoma grayi]KEG14027.1 hypothetical protein DQ04_00661050 [Trypanosoma grayi]